jgi:hypothetical protein
MPRIASVRQRLTLMVLGAGIGAVAILGIYFRVAIREE